MPVDLYEHQKRALRKMKNGCILCGGTGSGKSMTGIAYYLYTQGYDFTKHREIDIRVDAPADLYVITTARKRDTYEWNSDMTPFRLSPDKEFNAYGNKVTVDSWNNIGKYEKVMNAFFIFDEQRVVGNGAWVKSFLKITAKNKWILLSATPGDTWSDYIPVFIANGFYKNRTEFNMEHVIYSYNQHLKFPKIERYVGIGKLVRLRNDILVDMDVDRETVQHHITTEVPFDISEYKSCQRLRWNFEENRPIENASELCMQLRKIVNSDPARALEVKLIAESRGRVIIFYNYNYELDILRSIDFGDDMDVAEWNGHKHEPLPKSDKWVYLVQYTAGAEGWNCTSTDTIIFYSMNYSYRTMIQAAGRIDRINTHYKDLYYYHLKSRAPIDIAISRALKNKKDFNERRFLGI